MAAVLARLFEASPLFERAGRPRDAVYAGNFQAHPARDAAEIDEALRLRARVLELPPEPADTVADHLLVRERDTGRVVAACRVLRPGRVRRAGGLRVERDFDARPLAPLRDDLVELDGACLDPAVRGGPVSMLVCSALRRYLEGAGLRFAVGRVALPLADGGRYAAGAWRAAARQRLVPPSLRLAPRVPLALDALPEGDDPVLPSLLRAWLRAGAQVLGEPHVDADAGAARMAFLLDVERMAAHPLRRLATAIG